MLTTTHTNHDCAMSAATPSPKNERDAPPPRSGARQAYPLLAIGVLALSSCGTLPAAPPPAALPVAGAAPPSAAALASQVTVRGAQGVLSEAAQARAIEQMTDQGRGDRAAHHLAVLAAQGNTDLYRGNAARLLVDGPATFAAMKAAINAARHRVLLESYIFEDTGIAAEIGRMLIAKVEQGLSVALLYDAVGSIGSDPQFFDALRARGVLVCAFNPVNPVQRLGYWGINHRNHRKVLVADSDVAFTGGINISQVYSSGSGGSGSKGSSLFGKSAKAGKNGDALSEGWRDTQIELKGPVVAALAMTFGQTWREQGCKGELRAAPVPRQATAGDRIVKILPSHPTAGKNRIYTTLLAAIGAAQHSVHLTMAYFAPGPEMLAALQAAARRGVKVVMVLPGQSDFALVLHAGRSYYGELLAAGVEIHELARAVLHAKTAVIDGVFSTVGSSNMDWRSFVDNSELDAVVLGADFGAEMEAMFARDRAASPRIEAAAFADRPWRDRVMELLGRAAERWL